FPLKFASDLITAFNIVLEMPCVRRASAAAVKSREALPAVLLGINVAVLKFILHCGTGNSFVHISHKELFFSHELMAGIKIAPWGHRKIFRAGSASGKPFVHTRASGKIDHEMEEIKSLSLFFSSDHL